MKLEMYSGDGIVLGGQEMTVMRDMEGVPTHFLVLRPGVTELTINGQRIRGVVTDDDIQAIMDYHQAKGEDIPVDCEHILRMLADVDGVDESTYLHEHPLMGEKAAAGMVALTEKNGELWAVVNKWSKRARELLSSQADKLYAYFSPVFRGLKEGPLRITSIALTNNPALSNLDALAASGEIAFAMPAAYDRRNKQQTEHGVATMDMLKKLLGMLGLDAAAFTAEDASLEPVFQKAASELEAARNREAGFMSKIKDALSLTDDAVLDDVPGMVISLAAKSQADAAALSELQATLTDLQGEAFTRKVGELESAGKLTKAMQESDWFKGLDYAGLCEFSKIAPQVVKVERVLKKGDHIDQDDTLTMSDTAIQIARQAGMDPAKVAEVNGLKLPA